MLLYEDNAFPRNRLRKKEPPKNNVWKAHIKNSFFTELLDNLGGDSLSVGHTLYTDINASLWLRQLATTEVVILSSCNC